MLLLAVACAAFCTTFAGGLFALRIKDQLHLVLGFSAGAVIAVAFFDILPEAFELGQHHHSAELLLTCTALGFFLYMVLDRLLSLHGHAHGGHEFDKSMASERGSLGASSLSIHSLFDGMAIGLAFQASPPVGIVVAIAVLTHDFSDGINTINVVLKNGGSRRQALAWLSADASAPVLGIGSTFFFTLPNGALSLILALFAGFFLCLGASDLIPESHHAHPKFLTTFMTLLGAAVIYLAVTIAGR